MSLFSRVQSDKELEKALTKLESESLGYGPMPPKLPSIRVHSFDCLVCHVRDMSLVNSFYSCLPDIFFVRLKILLKFGLLNKMTLRA